jgi:hypothetical protein
MTFDQYPINGNTFLGRQFTGSKSLYERNSALNLPALICTLVRSQDPFDPKLCNFCESIFFGFIQKIYEKKIEKKFLQAGFTFPSIVVFAVGNLILFHFLYTPPKSIHRFKYTN